MSEQSGEFSAPQNEIAPKPQEVVIQQTQPEPETTQQPQPEPETTKQPQPEPETTKQPQKEPETTKQPQKEPETTQQPQKEIAQSEEKLTRRMTFYGVNGEQYKLLLPSVVNAEAMRKALIRAGAEKYAAQVATVAPATLQAKATDLLYELWEALGAKITPLKPKEVSGREEQVNPPATNSTNESKPQ